MAIPAGPMTRGNVPDLLERGIRWVYFNDYAERIKEYEQLFNIRGSVKQRERDVVMGGLGLIAQFGEGDAPTFDAGVEAWLQTYTHLQWGLGFKVTQIAQEDELYGVYARFSGELARATLYTQEIQAMTTFNNLSATAYTANSTAFTLLSSSQYRIDDGVWSNKLASGADLSVESLELALTQWRTGMVDLRGRKLATEPRVLVVGPSDRFIAERIVNSTQRPFTANNDDNTIKNLGLDVAVMTHMVDDGRWFLLGDKELTGLNWFNRRNISMQRQTAGDGSNNMIMVCSARWSSGTSHVFNLFGST